MFAKTRDNISYNFSMFKKKLMDKENRLQFLRKTGVSILIKLFKYLIVICIAFVFLYPFIYMIVTSVKSPNDLTDPTVKWIPKVIWRDNFEIAYRGLDYFRGIKNSAIITLIATFGHILSAALAGYSLARYRFKMRGVFLVFLVLQIITPPQILAIPSYIMYSNLNLLDGYLPIIVPTFFGAGIKGGIFIFIFRQFYMGVPAELEEAAKVDGCGPASTFLRIIIPMSKAPFLVSAVLSIVWHWTDTYESILLIRDKAHSVLVARLPDLFATLQRVPTTEVEWKQKELYNEAVVMASTFMVVAPILILYAILQRQFTQGIERSGIVG